MGLKKVLKDVMPRYKYHSLEIPMYPKAKLFHPDDLRGAVEFLKTVENRTEFTKLTAKANVRTAKFQVEAPAALSLEEMLGKTPKEVWEMLDRKIDDAVAYFKTR